MCGGGGGVRGGGGGGGAGGGGRGGAGPPRRGPPAGVEGAARPRRPPRAPTQPPPGRRRRADKPGYFFGFPQCHTQAGGDPYLRPVGPGGPLPDPKFNKDNGAMNCNGGGFVFGNPRVWGAPCQHVCACLLGASKAPPRAAPAAPRGARPGRARAPKPRARSRAAPPSLARRRALVPTAAAGAGPAHCAAGDALLPVRARGGGRRGAGGGGGGPTPRRSPRCPAPQAPDAAAAVDRRPPAPRRAPRRAAARSWELGKSWPREYDRAVIIAEHGSVDRWGRRGGGAGRPRSSRWR